MASKIKNVIRDAVSKSTGGSARPKQAGATNFVRNAAGTNVRQQIANNRNINNQNNDQTNRRAASRQPSSDLTDNSNAIAFATRPYEDMPNAATFVDNNLPTDNPDKSNILSFADDNIPSNTSSATAFANDNMSANNSNASNVHRFATRNNPDTSDALAFAMGQDNDDEGGNLSANNSFADNMFNAFSGFMGPIAPLVRGYEAIHSNFGTTEPINGTDKASEEDLEILQNMPEEERADYINYLQNYDGKITPESIQQWENQEDNPWGYEDTPETITFEDYVGELVNGDSPEAEAYRSRVLGGEEFDPVQDYAALAMDDSPEARALWSMIYSDPRAQQAYLDMLGESIDTDGNGVITPEEGGAFWDSMQEYSPESITYDPNDEHSQWIYGDMGEGYGGGNFQMDAFNQALYTNIIASTIEGGGSYADLVASGEIGQIVDSSGNDLVESLHLEDDWAASQNANLSESEREAAYNRYMSNLAELNNMYKTSAMGEYYANGGTGSYIDFGPGEGISDEDAVNMARGYLAYSNNTADANAGIMPESPFMNNITETLRADQAERYGEYDDIDSYFQAEEDRRRMASQAAGYQALLNNNAGGNSGYQFVNVDAYGSPYESVRQLDNGDVIFVDENGHETTASQITGTRGTRDINELTGTQYIDPDLAYLIAQNTGLADAGYGVYTDFAYQQPESTGNTNQVHATNPVAWEYNHQDMGEPWFEEPLKPLTDWVKQVTSGGYSTSNVSNQNARQVGSDSNRWGYTDPRKEEIAAEEAYDTINALGGSVQGNTYSNSRR